MPLLDIFSKKKDKKEEKIKIEVDFREKNSLVASYLVKEGFDVEFKQLNVGDYIIKDVAIERKTISDLKSSIVDKRIFRQLIELKQYPKSFLILEGFFQEGKYEGGINENAFRGFLIALSLEWDTKVIFSENEKDSAKYISVLARRKEYKEFSLKPSKTFLTKEEQIQYILEGFPNVGPKKAKKLIEKFGSLKSIFNASREELEEILGKRASDFVEMVEFKA